MDKPCILSNECLSHGYPRVKIAGEYVWQHRYILQLKLDRPIKEGFEACHLCNITNCIEPEHIVLKDINTMKKILELIIKEIEVAEFVQENLPQ